MPSAVKESKPSASATLTTRGVKARYSSLHPASVEKVASVVMRTGIRRTLRFFSFSTRALSPATIAPVLARILREPPTMKRKAMILIPPLNPLLIEVKKSRNSVGFCAT